MMDPSGTHAVLVPDSAREARTDIVTPQYAYFYNAAKERCEPVIVLQAEGSVMGYEAVQGGRSKAASEVFFDLLGTDPPPGQTEVP